MLPYKCYYSDHEYSTYLFQLSSVLQSTVFSTQQVAIPQSKILQTIWNIQKKKINFRHACRLIWNTCNTEKRGSRNNHAETHWVGKRVKQSHEPFGAGIIFWILAHSVYKMWIIQEPNKLALWNKLDFEEKKNGEYRACLKYSVPIFVEEIYKMQHSEVSGAVRPIYRSLGVKRLKVWTSPEGSRRLRPPDFKTIGTWRW